MNALRGLRLNCLLAPLLVGAVAAGVLIVQHQVHARQLLEQAAEAARQAAAAAAARDGGDGTAGLLAEQSAGGWSGIALVRSNADGFATLGSAGALTAWRDGDPRPELLDVVHGPVAWSDGDRLCAAARMATAPGTPAVLIYGERPLPPAPGRAGLLAWLAALLGIAGLMAWYLAARIWRPVEHLAATARAALEDLPAPDEAAASAETGELRSSVVLLAERYRSRSSPPPRP